MSTKSLTSPVTKIVCSALMGNKFYSPITIFLLFLPKIYK